VRIILLDKGHICMGILEWFGLNLGINLHCIAIYAHISPITLCFGLLGFDCRFARVVPNVRRKLRNWGQPSQEKLQNKPNSPKSDDPRQKPTNQKDAPKRSGAGKPRPVVSFSLVPFRFPARFSDLNC